MLKIRVAEWIVNGQWMVKWWFGMEMLGKLMADERLRDG